MRCVAFFWKTKRAGPLRVRFRAPVPSGTALDILNPSFVPLASLVALDSFAHQAYSSVERHRVAHQPGDVMSHERQKLAAPRSPRSESGESHGNTGQRDRIEITVDGVRIDVSPQLEDAVRRAHQGLLRPLPKEMTTNQAAEFLDVSRPFVIKLTQRGELPFRQSRPAPAHSERGGGGVPREDVSGGSKSGRRDGATVPRRRSRRAGTSQKGPVMHDGAPGRRLRRLRSLPKFSARPVGSSGNPRPAAGNNAGQVDGPHPPRVDRCRATPKARIASAPAADPNARGPTRSRVQGTRVSTVGAAADTTGRE